VTFLQLHEPGLRLGFFLALVAVMSTWEVLAPRRPLSQPRTRRWFHNLGLVTLNTVLVRLSFPFAAVALAARAQAQGWGLLNLWAGPDWLELVLAVLALDLTIWAQHVMFHAVPALWRLHQVHHSDPNYDFTTGVRFHPIEIALSMLIKFGAILVLGPSPAAVIVFEVVLNGMAMFNHGNVGLPAPVDRLLRLLVVTPDMHRVHHSVEVDETNSNFGFNLSWWDRLLGTYRAQPRAGHLAMTIGVPGVRSEPPLSALLALPFRR
jgi:sterol desaturase/sphingolipid hydroxylase (fatty acid hydroxylase superfamily)